MRGDAHEEGTLFSDGRVGRCDGCDCAGRAGASGSEDGAVAEHCYEYDDGVTDSARGSGADAGDGKTGAGRGSENDDDAIVSNAGQVAEVDYRYAAGQELSIYECQAERDGDVGRYDMHDAAGELEGAYGCDVYKPGEDERKVHMEITTERQSQPIVMDMTFDSVYQGADCKGISPDSPKIVH